MRVREMCGRVLGQRTGLDLMAREIYLSGPMAILVEEPLSFYAGQVGLDRREQIVQVQRVDAC